MLLEPATKQALARVTTMAIRTILKSPKDDEILRKKCRDVEVFDGRLHDLIDDLLETAKAADGLGLAAIQVGILKRVCVIEDGENNLIEVVNPKIKSGSGAQYEVEGCLSIPEKSAKVKRPETVTVKFFDRFGNKQTIKASGLLARIFCHEIDHMDGVLYSDYAGKLSE
jgi:peptide deformylase